MSDAATVADGVPPASADSAQPQIRVVLTAVFVLVLAQMTLNPVIAPLARAVNLAEWQVGLVISVAAMSLVVGSRWGAGRSQVWGRKPVLLVAIAVGTVAMTAFALTAWWAMLGLIGATVLFVLWLLLRGILFGGAISAVVPTAQAFIADVTDTEAARVKGMAGIGAAQGLAMVAGAVVGGLLGGIGILVPLVAVPVLMAVALALVARRMRRQAPHELTATPRTVRARDPRVLPFLLAGFGMYTALGFIQVLTGFIVTDRFGLAPEPATLMTGLALLGAGAGMVLAQTVIVPRSGWPPNRLLQVGCGVALVGFAGLLPEWPLPVLIGAVALIGLGLGIAQPGYTAGPSLRLDPEEQPALAGLIGATNGLTFVVTPTLATVLYGFSRPAPLIASAVTMAIVLAFVLANPTINARR